MQTRRTATPTRRGKASRAAASKPKQSKIVSSSASKASAAKDSRRMLLVMVSLVAVMSLTSMLLMVMRTDPLVPDISRSLLATDSPDELDRLFDTKTPLASRKWAAIFIHHSRTAGGSAEEMADGSDAASSADAPGDHFVIGNGNGSADGSIQISQRWDQQNTAGRIAGVERMDPGCISICLVGDLDRTRPTANQMQSLRRLVTALQRRLQVGAQQVWLLDSHNTPADAGALFPRHSFRQQLIP